MQPLPNRKSIRLKNYDYSQDGYYFVTLNIKNRIRYFGEINNGKMKLSQYGKFAEKCWLEIPQHFPNAILDAYAIMPDHIHGIIIIRNDLARNKNSSLVRNKDFCSQRDLPWQTQLSKSLSSIVRGFKIGVTKYFHKQGNDHFQWQKSFYDEIIRDDRAFYNIRRYIRNNPLSWSSQ